MSHYSLAHNPEALLKWSRVMANKLAKRFKDNLTDDDAMVPIFVYRGMSGIATATALSLVINGRFKYKMCYVRKWNEKSNGENYIETTAEKYMVDRLLPIFVDDFICAGKTFGECFARYQSHFEVDIEVKDVMCVFTNSTYAVDRPTEPVFLPEFGEYGSVFTSAFKRANIEEYLKSVNGVDDKEMQDWDSYRETILAPLDN